MNTIIEHLNDNYPWVWYFGFEGPWIKDHKCVPLKPSSFFKEIQKGGFIWHCKSCCTAIFLLRALTFSITIPRDVIARWFWRSKYTIGARLNIIKYYSKEEN